MYLDWHSTRNYEIQLTFFVYFSTSTAPPTYEEAMSTVTNTEGDEGPAPMDANKPFIPLYPVYNFGDPGPEQQ